MKQRAHSKQKEYVCPHTEDRDDIHMFAKRYKHLQATRHKYYLANRVHILDLEREWQKKHPNWRQDWLATHPGYMKLYMRGWRLEQPHLKDNRMLHQDS